MTPETKGVFLFFWLLVCCVYGILWFRRFYLDKKDSFAKYVTPDLSSYKLILESSAFIKNKTPDSIAGYKQALHAASGGFRIATFDGYKIYRTVMVKDKFGKVHEFLAAIEFDDRSLFRRFKGVSWSPELRTLREKEK